MTANFLRLLQNLSLNILKIQQKLPVLRKDELENPKSLFKCYLAFSVNALQK